MAISRGARHTGTIIGERRTGADVVEEIAKKSQTVADLFLLGVETQLRGVDMREWKWSDLDIGSQVLRITQDKNQRSRRGGTHGDRKRRITGTL